jgi:thiol-disulfide isomerase/thioredoxin
MSVPPMLVRRQWEPHRKSRHRLLWSSMVVAAIVLLSGCAGSSGSTMPPAANSSTAAALDAAAVSADTSVPELLRFAATTVDGQQFDGRQLAGKPALVWFWASWCPICAGQAPLMKLLRKDLDGTGVQVVTIAGLGGSTAD